VRGLPKSFQFLVKALEALPTIGRKSALRLAFHIVLNNPHHGVRVAHAIEEALSHLTRCRRCRGLSEDELCPLCSDPLRERDQLCLVESGKEIYLIEESGGYQGLYFVLDQLDEEVISQLKTTIEENGTREIIFALTPSIQSEGTMLYIEELLKESGIRFSRIAQGVPTGVDLENIDALSLSRALKDRVPR